MRKCAPISLALMAVLVSCLPAKRAGRPAWVVSQADACCPPDEFLLAAAEGKTPADAERAARKALDEKIEPLIAESCREATGEHGAGTEAVKTCIEWLKGNVPEASVARRFGNRSGGYAAVLVALDRARFAGHLASLSAKLGSEASAGRDRAKKQWSEGRAGKALCSALRAISLGLRASAVARLARRISAAAGEIPPAAATSTLLQEMAGQLALRLVSKRPKGSGYELLLGTYAGTESASVPAEGLVVDLQVEGKHQLSCRTDSLGICEARLEWKNRWKNGVEILLKLQTGAIADCAGIGKTDPLRSVIVRLLDRKKVTARLSPPARKGSRVMVLLQQSVPPAIAAKIQPPGVVLESELRRAGLVPASTEPVAEELAMAEGDEEYRQIVGPHAEFFLMASAALRPGRKIADNFTTCKTLIKARLLETGSKSPSIASKLECPAAGLDFAAACRRALRGCMRKLVRRITTHSGQDGNDGKTSPSP